jgi:hypothetical protein
MASTLPTLALGDNHPFDLGDLSTSHSNNPTTSVGPSSSSAFSNNNEHQYATHSSSSSSSSRRISVSASKRLSVNIDLANAGASGEPSHHHNNHYHSQNDAAVAVPMEKRKSGGASGSRKNRESGLPSPPLTGESMEHLPTDNDEILSSAAAAAIDVSDTYSGDDIDDGAGAGVGVAMTSGDDGVTSLKPSAADQASSTVFDHPLADLDDGRKGTFATSASAMGDDDRTHVGGIDDSAGMDITDVDDHNQRSTTAIVSDDDDEVYPLGHPRFSLIRAGKKQQEPSSSPAAAATSSSAASPYPWERFDRSTHSFDRDDVTRRDGDEAYHTTTRTQNSGKRKSYVIVRYVYHHAFSPCNYPLGAFHVLSLSCYFTPYPYYPFSSVVTMTNHFFLTKLFFSSLATYIILMLR